MLHVLNIRANLVYVVLLGKVRVESDKIVMTKNDVFVGKNNCNQGHFVRNISDNIMLVVLCDFFYSCMGW